MHKIRYKCTHERRTARRIEWKTSLLTETPMEENAGAKWGGGASGCPGILGPSSAFSSSRLFRQAAFGFRLRSTEFNEKFILASQVAPWNNFSIDYQLVNIVMWMFIVVLTSNLLF